MTIQIQAPTAVQTVINDNASLANNTRAAGDYDNGTARDLFAIAYLQVQFDTTAPTAGDIIGYLYNLPGDGEATEIFPEGGDAGLGSNFTPQGHFLVATFVTVDPSTTTDEVLGSLPFSLYPDNNRLVFENVSGQTMDLTWELRIKPFRYQVS